MVSSMIVGNTAYNMSHKSDAPEEINSPLIQEMAFYAADALRQLPPDLQADALQHTAAFLAKKTGGTEQALSAHLQERLEALAVPAWSPEQESSWRQRTDEMRHAAQAVPSL